MKSFLITCSVFLFLTCEISLAQNDSQIRSMIGEISKDSVRSTIQSLQDFRTRYAFASNRDSVTDWIVQKFKKIGFDPVEVDSFLSPRQPVYSKIVVATIRGMRYPDQILILGAHYDSHSRTSPPDSLAPGADDDASGTAGVIEIARVMKWKAYQSDCTIKFMAFPDEEVGASASLAQAQRFKSQNTEIRMMMYLDMIAYNTKRLDSSIITLAVEDSQLYLSNYAAAQMNTYCSVHTIRSSVWKPFGDAFSYKYIGYPALCVTEDIMSPYYHSDNDVVANYDMAFCTEIIKGVCATLMGASSSILPFLKLSGISVIDGGDGGTLRVSWQRIPINGLKGYKVRVGKQSGIYDTLFVISDSVCILHHLSEGVRVFIGISGLDSLDRESLICEGSGIPYSKPAIPANAFAEPDRRKVSLHWNANTEYDFLGYNVYRSLSRSSTATKLTSNPIRGTFFIDSTVDSGVMYYYTIAAVDSAFNESPSSKLMRSRLVSLNKGILLVSGTQGGSGERIDPTWQQIDEFYASVFRKFTVQSFSADSLAMLQLADLGAFSSVFIHDDDVVDATALYPQHQEIAKYLSYGGKIFFAGYFPTKALAVISGYPQTFKAGDFIYDFMKIGNTSRLAMGRFFGGQSVIAGYPTIGVDTSKTDPGLDYHLLNIESIEPAQGAASIYTYETRYDTVGLFGKMMGLPVGVEFLGPEYEAITVSFPLYFMEQTAAEKLIEHIFAAKFSEPMFVDRNRKGIIDQFSLKQNYPNPFNPSTKIQFSIEREGLITLRIYDILGCQVTALVDKQMEPGIYIVEWNASKVASGVYFCQLQSGNSIKTRKMIVLR